MSGQKGSFWVKNGHLGWKKGNFSPMSHDRNDQNDQIDQNDKNDQNDSIDNNDQMNKKGHFVLKRVLSGQKRSFQVKKGHFGPMIKMTKLTKMTKTNKNTKRT